MIITKNYGKKMTKGIFLILILSVSFTASADIAYDYSWNDDNKELIDFVSKNKTRLVPHLVDSYEKAKEYRQDIETIFNYHGIPSELYALASIESNYSPNAVSTQKAVGMWQFMSKTGIEMGLEINNKVDERKNWRKSTHAAAKYLKHLAEDFFDGNYELAILAYNAGVGNVKKAIKANNSTDPWVLIKDSKSFKQESVEYLPKVIAAIHIFNYIDKKVNINLAQN